MNKILVSGYTMICVPVSKFDIVKGDSVVQQALSKLEIKTIKLTNDEVTYNIDPFTNVIFNISPQLYT